MWVILSEIHDKMIKNKVIPHFNGDMMLELKIDKDNRYNHFFLNGDGFIKKANLKRIVELRSEKINVKFAMNLKNKSL